MQQGTDCSQGSLLVFLHSLVDPASPFFWRRDSTTILAGASRVHKIQTEENDQTNVASLFVSPLFWEPSLENGLASEAPFLLMAALDYLSPLIWYTKKTFFFPLGYTHQKDYMQQN